MKKTLTAAAILAGMTLAVAAPAFAASANPFVDVPANHWAYDSVSKLAASGIVDGYGDGTFKGDKTMTRYEMAQITAKALAKYEAASAEDKAVIDKLTNEFGDELKNLGVRVAALEKNQSKIKITGETRLLYHDHDDEPYKSDFGGDKAFQWRQRLYLNADINEKISYTGRLEAVGTFGSNSGDDVRFNRNYITVKDFLGIDAMMLGKQGAYFGKNMNVGKSSDNNGIALVHKAGDVTLSGFVFSEGNNTQLNGIYAGTKLGKKGDIEIGYTKSDAYSTYPEAKSFDIGASVQLSNGFALVGEFVDTSNSNAPDGDAYAIQLTKGTKQTKIISTSAGGNLVDRNKPHTDGFLLGYRKIERNALTYGGAASIFNGTGFHGINDANDVEGWMFAYQNVVAKNTILSFEYQDLEKESTGADLDKSIVAHLQLWF